MENLISKRIKDLRLHYNLGMKEFSTRCGLSHVAIFHLETGKTLKPHRSSIVRMANVFGSTVDWILFGNGEMLPNGSKELYNEEGNLDGYWKDEAYQEIKNKNIVLEREIERLWQMIHHFTSGEQPNIRRVMEAG